MLSQYDRLAQPPLFVVVTAERGEKRDEYTKSVRFRFFLERSLFLSFLTGTAVIGREGPLASAIIDR